MNFSKFGNKLTLTSACLLTNLILAGFMVQIGLLTEPISRTFDVEITYAAKQFSFLYGGYFAGSIIAFFILDYVSIRVALLTNCVIIILSTVVLYILKSVVLLPLIFAVIGIMGGIAACIAGTIISIIWQKKFRDSLLLAQDASFNLGGSLYPLLTAIILTRDMPWTVSYLVVAAGLIVVIFFVLISTFDSDVKPIKEQKDDLAVEWNAGVIAAGLALFLTITGKYTIITWLPNYAETVLGATTEQAGQLISTIFAAALLGSVAGAIIVSKLRLSYFIIFAVSIGFISSIQFTFAKNVNELLILSGFFGLAISVLFNVFTAYGIGFVKKPSHKHIAFILFCGGLASITPYLSSGIVELFGTRIALISGAALYAVVLVILITFELVQKSKQKLSYKSA